MIFKEAIAIIIDSYIIANTRYVEEEAFLQSFKESSLHWNS